MSSKGRPTDGSHDWSTIVLLYFVFMATGVGLVLPGALLPPLLLRWSLTDEQAGVLFFCLFIGSMLGALLARWSLPWSILRGCLAVSLGAVVLAFASRAIAFGAMAIYGLGLGIVMTSVSLLELRRYPSERAAHITRLNFVWALGACLGPSLALRGAAVFGTPRTLFGLASVFCVAGLLTPVLAKNVVPEPVTTTNWWHQVRSIPAALLLMVPFATGIESAVNGWLATYSRRSGQTLGVTIGAATCFWVGLLLSRLVQSNRRVAAASGKWLLMSGPLLIFLSLCLPMGSSGSVLTPMAALMLGAGVGPMYPALLARVLHRGEGGNTVFLVAGVGSSLLPLLTGLVSGWTGSLRFGLGVPLGGAIVMVLCGWLTARRDVE